jgi:CRP-like cAMP-binding protein
VLRRNEKVELIKKAPLFAHTSKRELQEVAQLADEIDLREGKEMTRQGQPGREFFVLLEGTADVI